MALVSKTTKMIFNAVVFLDSLSKHRQMRTYVIELIDSKEIVQILQIFSMSPDSYTQCICSGRQTYFHYLHI